MIDVFADVPLAGNPLSVVQGADELSDEQMLRIAEGPTPQSSCGAAHLEQRSSWDCLWHKTRAVPAFLAVGGPGDGEENPSVESCSS
jgi:hypothetical protein